jgi:hypothetical protein
MELVVKTVSIYQAFAKETYPEDVKFLSFSVVSKMQQPVSFYLVVLELLDFVRHPKIKLMQAQPLAALHPQRTQRTQQ